MKAFRSAILASAAIALPAPALAQAAQQCLTPVEAQDLMTFALPDMIGAVSTKCSAALPSSAYLKISGPALIARYRVGATAAWPRTKGAVGKLGGLDEKMLAALPDDALKSLVSAGIGVEIAKGIKPESCDKFDRITQALAPLPPENMASLIGTILELVSQDKKGQSGAKASGLNICPSRPLASGSTPTK